MRVTSDTVAKELLALRGVSKSFPGVQALKSVSLNVRCGEVHAIVGENGAGKSTLMQILAGVYQPDAGQIDFDGRESIVIRDERSAQDQGIALVYQERSLFGAMSVAENIFAARQPVSRWGFIDRPLLAARSRALLDEVGLDLDVDAALETLSSAQQQLVEVAKALSLEPKLILFDEPTAALALAETGRLFNVIRRLRSRAVGIIYISHRLEEVFAIADRVSILRDGTGQGTFDIRDLKPGELVNRMVGREFNPHVPREDAAPPQAPVVLEARGISDPVGGPTLRPRLNNIDMAVRAGEIVGLSGLVGAGRTELALALFGARKKISGELWLDGRRVSFASPADAIAAGIGYLPEDRKDDGLFLDMSIEDNMAAVASTETRSWRYDRRQQRALAEEMCRTLRIVCRGPTEPVRNLSGGNQQKVVLAKWLLAKPRVLIVDEPTRGVDVGAKAEIHDLLYRLARTGTAVLVISSDLPEILAVSDRILVMREGRITGEFPRDQATEPLVMHCASMGERSET